MASSGRALPGFESPAASFEQPYDMLEACHERVLRSLDLLGRLVDYIISKGHDTQTQSAAADVLRYFDLAAPLHHQDEEQHVFPRLLAQGSAAQRDTVQRLQVEHRRMEQDWAVLRTALLRWREHGCTEAVNATTREAAARFAALYTEHLNTEDTLVFPAALALTPKGELERMGAEMQARRQG
jgi:hemerythrin-like domain-containing protein